MFLVYKPPIECPVFFIENLNRFILKLELTNLIRIQDRQDSIFINNLVEFGCRRSSEVSFLSLKSILLSLDTVTVTYLRIKMKLSYRQKS